MALSGFLKTSHRLGSWVVLWSVDIFEECASLVHALDPLPIPSGEDRFVTYTPIKTTE